MTDKELVYYLHTTIRYMELLYISSNRGGKFKTYGINAAIQNAFQKIAHDFNLVPGIESFLIETGRFSKRKYRVSDLRKFPDYARILGFKDKKSYRPDKLFEFTISQGWILNYILHVKPVLPHGADMKLRKAEYILDIDRRIPGVVKEAIAQAEYWEIVSFELVKD